MPTSRSHIDRSRTARRHLLRAALLAASCVAIAAGVAHLPASAQTPAKIPQLASASFAWLSAGAEWRDEEVVVCDHVPGVIVSSRKPDDLPAFCRTLVEQFSMSRAAA